MQSIKLIEPARLSDYLAAGIVQRMPGRRLRFRPEGEWAQAGESRLGYTQLVRLVECARELHWGDLNCPADVDNTVRILSLDFRSPVLVGHSYDLAVRCEEVTEHGFWLMVRCFDTASDSLAFEAKALILLLSGATGALRRNDFVRPDSPGPPGPR